MPRTRFSNPELVTLLGSPAWSLCEGCIREFEEAWRRGRTPALSDFLRVDGPERRALLVELIHVELEFRMKSGETARVEPYLITHPELAEDRRGLLDLLAAEYQLRRRYERGVEVQEYGTRFPEYADDLLVRLAGVLEETADPAPGPPSTPWPAVPGYEIVGELGRGGMGVVYKAREPSLARHVALKFLPFEYAHDPDRLDRFRREARTASALNHPHICTVHALGEHEGRPFIVMEFIEGITLQSLASRRPAVADVARLFRQAARALAAAHAAGVVHRDLKPENVMVRADGYVKVLDFGLARRLPAFARGASEAERDTDPGAVMGTVAYMSPEQARGETAESASDIFSLGIVLYQLLTGRHPFEAESIYATLAAVAMQQPVPPSRINPEIPAALDGLIEAMLHKDARLRPTASEVENALGALTGAPAVRSAPPAPSRPVVRREPELAALQVALAAADSGRGSIVCVAGEPGIGKTTLVDDFLDALNGPDAPVPDCLVAPGRCSERLAGSEAYLPVLDALADVLRSGASDWVARLMKVVAPTWYARVAPAAAEAAGAARAASQQAMLREFFNLLQEASRRGPVVLFFDDVHWADLSTVDLLAYLGRQLHGLRVLIVVSYRPTDLLLGPHPFHRVKQELQGKGVCAELPLGFLARRDVDYYLTLAFPGHAFPEDFADLIYARTEGSPLFMADLLRDLRERGVVAEVGGRWSLVRELPDLRRELPGSVRGVIRRELDRLTDGDRRLLAAAAVQGSEFDSAVVAGALELDPADVEERLQVLERVHGLIRPVREYELPDRTLTLRYAFVHVLYQQALYADLPPARRGSLAASLARVLEGHHGEGASNVSAELACLYEVGRDFGEAARHFHLACQNASRVFAHREALGLARRGLSLLEPLSRTPERSALELPLQTALGLHLQIINGFAAPGAEMAYSRARELCRYAADPTPLFPVLWGLWLYSKARSDLARARERAEELRELAQRLNDPALALQAQQAMAVTALCAGEPASTLRHAELAAALYDPARHRTHTARFGQDPGVACKAFGAVALWLLGYPDEARRQSAAAIRLSEELSQPSSQALALLFAAMLHQLCRDGPETRRCAEACRAIAAEHGFSFWLAGATVMNGWAVAACGDPSGGAELLRQGLREWAATGSVTYRTYYLGLLAEVLIAQDAAPEARRVLEESLELARRTGEGLYEAELQRLSGELRLRVSAEPSDAAEHFNRALDLARRQGARSLELRAAMSLAHLDRRSGPWDVARERLTAVHSWFSEGLDTHDLQEARALLEGTAP